MLNDISLEVAAIALSYIDAHNRDTWLKVGNALKTEFGSSGFDVFDNWSQTADNYDAKAVKSVWRSLSVGKVNIGTVIFLAKQNGFDISKHEVKPIDPQEQAARQAKREQQAREAEAHEKAEKAAFEMLMKNIIRASNDALSTPYTDSKGITTTGLLSINSDELHAFKHPFNVHNGKPENIGYALQGLITVVPFCDLKTGEFVKLQGISGVKATEGKDKGRYIKRWIGKGDGYYWCGDILNKGKPKVITEGMSDAQTIHEYTNDNLPSLASGNDGSLKKAALALRAECPHDPIIVFGDNDVHGGGQAKAKAAATAINGIFMLPPSKYKDVNEWVLAEGAEGLNKMIDEAIQTKKAVLDATSTAPLNDDLARESIDDVGNGGESQGDEWQEPDPIIAPQEMADYPIQHLPEPLRLLVLEIVDYLQCPIAMAANAVLAALSLSIQGLVNVARDNELIGAVSLFLMVIAESGERKSACDSLVTSHIKELDKQRLLADLDVLKFWQSDMDTWTAEREGLINAIKQTAKNGDSTHSLKEQLKQLDEEKPKKPRGKTMLYEDATIEGLTKGLFNNCPSGGVFSSEAGVVFGSHGMNSDNSMRNMATTNKLWDGGDVITNRADITKNMLLTGRRLTLSLATQESTVRAFFDSSKGLARGTGFGARFLIAWPKSTQGTRLYKAPPLSWPNREAFVKRTTELLNTILTIDEESGALQPITLYLSPQAHDLWVEFYNYTEQELRIGGELADIKDVTSKAADNVARIAALFHVYEHGLTGHITEAHILSANYLMDWYLMESKRFFSEAVLSKELRNTVLLDNWLIQHCQEQQTNHISTRDIQRKCPNSLRDKDLIDAILKHLADLNRVKIVNQGKKKLIALNPKLLGV